MIEGRLHSIETFGAVDGPGIRTVFFLQGCNGRCVYCHNPDTWEIDGGRLVDVNEIVKRALGGKTYYGKTGGVTFSGGEPLLQGRFIEDAIRALKKEGIHSAIDTSGIYADEYTEAAVDVCDLVLLDIKHPEPDMFRKITGAGQENLLRLIDIINRSERHVWIRHVVVPGINDKHEDMEALCEFIKRVKYIDKVELIGYHTMAMDKYRRLNMEYSIKNTPPMSKDRLQELQEYVAELMDE